MRAIPRSSNDRMRMDKGTLSLKMMVGSWKATFLLGWKIFKGHVKLLPNSFATITGKGDNPRWMLILADICFPCWNRKDWHSLRRAICKTRPVMKKRIPQGLVPHILGNVVAQVFSASLFFGKKSEGKIGPKKNPLWKIGKIAISPEDSRQCGDFGGRGL